MAANFCIDGMSIVDMEAVLKKIENNGNSFNGHIPVSLMNHQGKYALGKGGGWTDGFYIGVFNLAYLLSGDMKFRRFAEQYDSFLKLRIKNDDETNRQNRFLKLDHDVGLIFLPSSGFAYSHFGHQKDKDILISAANVLAERYNPKGRFISAWNTWDCDTDQDFIEEKKGKAIVDSLMNIPLLFRAAKITGNQDYHDVAYNHAKTMSEYIVREDGSTFHTYNFNYKTGEPVRGKTQQGFSDDSCWSRGQAWAVYGFALAYKYTNDKEFLEKSEKTAAYFMANLSICDLPAWDFAAKGKTEFVPWDASAATICASGLLELYELTGNEEHRKSALRLIYALERYCITDSCIECQPLVLHNTAGPAYKSDACKNIVISCIDQASVYADYFYLECKVKLSGKETGIF